MSLEARLEPGGKLFSPARDLRWIYPQAIKAVCEHFNKRAWPDLIDLAAREGADWDDLCDALDKYCNYLNASVTDPEKSLHQVLEQVGWFEQPPAAQIAIMAMLGRVVTGQLFDSLRSTTYLGEAPEGIEDVMAAAIEALRTGRQRSWYQRLWRKLFSKKPRS